MTDSIVCLYVGTDRGKAERTFNLPKRDDFFKECREAFIDGSLFVVFLLLVAICVLLF